jgi:hypothetical protein
LYAFLISHACYMSRLLLDLITLVVLVVLVKCTRCEAPHYAVFSNLHLRSKYSPQHPVLKTASYVLWFIITSPPRLGPKSLFISMSDDHSDAVWSMQISLFSR